MRINIFNCKGRRVWEKLPVYYRLSRCLHMMNDGHIGIINKIESLTDVTLVDYALFQRKKFNFTVKIPAR